MTQELQDIVDTLAAELHRGVAIDDRQLRLLAHSAHGDGVDSVRRRSIMTRQVSEPVRQWVHGCGVAEAQSAVRMEANPRIHAVSRVCAPIRCRELLLGFLFVMDEDEGVTDEELRRCEESAHEAGEVLFEHRFLQQRERGHERELLRNVVDADSAVRARAAATLINEGFLGSEDVVAVAVGVVEGDEPAAAEGLALPFAAILDRVRRGLPPHTALGALRPRHAALLLETSAIDRTFGGFAEFATWLRDLSDRELDAAACKAVVGGGDPVEALASAWQSYEQATRSLHVAARVSRFDRVLTWQGAGLYRILAHLSVQEAAEGCDRRLLPLLEYQELVKTLEAYLDLAGDAKATSDALTLHRASLYYRLQKIEQISGVNLKSGDDRLALHLGLKLLRLANTRLAS